MHIALSRIRAISTQISTQDGIYDLAMGRGHRDSGFQEYRCEEAGMGRWRRISCNDSMSSRTRPGNMTSLRYPSETSLAMTYHKTLSLALDCDELKGRSAPANHVAKQRQELSARAW